MLSYGLDFLKSHHVFADMTFVFYRFYICIPISYYVPIVFHLNTIKFNAFQLFSIQCGSSGHLIDPYSVFPASQII